MRSAKSGAFRLSRLWLRDLGDEAQDIAWSPDGERVAIAHGEGSLTLSDAVRGMPLARAKTAHETAIRALAWSPRSPILVSACSQGRVRMWAVNEAEPIGELDLGEVGAGPVSWSPDGRGLVAASGNRLVVTDDALGVQSVATLEVEQVRALSWRPNSRQIVASGCRGLEIVDGVSGRLLGGFPEETALASIAWTADGARLAAGGEDGRLFCWDFRASVTGFVEGPGGAVRSVAWGSRGECVLAGSERGWLMWRPSSVDDDGGPRFGPGACAGEVRALDVAEGGARVAFAKAEGALEVWPVADAAIQLARTELAAAPRALHWGPRAGRFQLAVALEEGLIEMLELVGDPESER